MPNIFVIVILLNVQPFIFLTIHAKINLIPYNKVEGLKLNRPSEPVQEAFLAALTSEGASVTLRREKGHDIDASCGQLRLRMETELAADSN